MFRFEHVLQNWYTPQPIRIWLLHFFTNEGQTWAVQGAVIYSLSKRNTSQLLHIHFSHVSEQFSGFSLRWGTTVFKVISSEWFPMKALAIRYCNDFMPVVIIPHRYSWTCIDIFQWKNFKHLATDCDIRRAKRANHESQWSLEIMFWKRKKTSNVNPQNNLFFMPTDCWVYPFAHQFLFSFFFHQRTERSNIKRWWVNLGSPQIRCRLWKMCIKNHPVRNWIAQLWLLTAISFKLRCYFI